MPNFKKAINNLLLKLIKIDGLTVESYIEKEAHRRSSVWRKDKDGFASACQQLNDIIFKKDEEIILLKATLSNTPTKKMIFDQYLQEQIDSGGLTGHNLTEKQIQMQEHIKTINDSGITNEDLKFITSSEGSINGDGK